MKSKTFVIALITVGLVNCSPSAEESSTNESKTVLDPATSSIATAPIMRADGTKAGLATLATATDRLIMKVTLSSMPSGEKALHLHTTGACEAPDFKSAGGHLNPTAATHGKLSETGPHLGDFPNVEIASDGLADVSLTIAADINDTIQHILDDDGTAIMIHAGPDDYKSDPAGAAGPRIACGVFEPTKP